MMKSKEVALIAAAILVSAWGTDSTPDEAKRVAENLTRWLERYPHP